MSKAVAVVRAHRSPPQTARATRETEALVRNLGLRSGSDRTDYAAIQRTTG
jgi:hypothetical protein